MFGKKIRFTNKKLFIESIFFLLFLVIILTNSKNIFRSKIIMQIELPILSQVIKTKNILAEIERKLCFEKGKVAIRLNNILGGNFHIILIDYTSKQPDFFENNKNLTLNYTAEELKKNGIVFQLINISEKSYIEKNKIKYIFYLIIFFLFLKSFLYLKKLNAK